jgi:hypothetical protein
MSPGPHTAAMMTNRARRQLTGDPCSGHDHGATYSAQRAGVSRAATAAGE